MALIIVALAVVTVHGLTAGRRAAAAGQAGAAAGD
jgi:hypothetical protein